MRIFERLLMDLKQVTRTSKCSEDSLSLTFLLGRYKDVEKLITSRILLEDVVRGGFEELVTNKDSHVKILVTPRRDLLLRTA